MHKKYSHLLIPESNMPRNVLPVLEKINESCIQYLKVQDKREILELLHSRFWQSLMGFIPYLITEETKEAFYIPEEYRNWINFGCVSNRLCPDYKEICNTQEEIPAEMRSIYDEYECYYFDQWLLKVYAEKIQLEYKKRVAEALETAKEEWNNYPALVEECYIRRRDFLRRHPDAGEVMKISEEIDKRLPLHTEIKTKIERGERIVTKERILYVQLTDDLSNLRELRTREQQAISDKVPQHEMMRLDREIEEVITLKRILEENLNNAIDAYIKDAEFRANLTTASCRRIVRDEIRRLYNMEEIIGKRSRIKQCSVLTDSSTVTTSFQIVVAIEEILEIDSTLFPTSGKKQMKFPNILILPGVGDGIYDFQRHALLIPTRPLRGLFQAVATALIEHFLDTDAGMHFRDQYWGLRRNERITSSIKFRERMLGDYLAWLMYEARGYQVLDAETRKWFIEHVAPSKFSLKHLRRLGNFTVPDAHELIERCEQCFSDIEGDFDALFKLGLACWRVGQFEKASDSFVRASLLRPDSLDACYNAGLSCLKIGRLQKAMDYWKTYFLLDKGSFWMLRVREFINSVR